MKKIYLKGKFSSVVTKFTVVSTVFFAVNTIQAQTNALPPSGNVGIGTTTPTSRLQVNGTARIDSSLYVKDSVVIQSSASVRDVLRVGSDVIVKGNINVKNDFKVNGKATLKGDVVIKEGDLRLKNIADSLQEGYGVLLINKNGKVVNGGSALNIFYDAPNRPVELNCEIIPNFDFPQWERASMQMFLLPNRCLDDPKLGVGIKPTAKLHVLNNNSETLPLLIERKTAGNQPNYKLLQLDHSGVLFAHTVKVNAQNWPDFVFENDYKLQPLSEVERYIQEHKHLPNVPSAKEVEEDGLNVGEMNRLLLQKVEELTLHLIEQQKRIDELERQIKKP